MSGLEPLVALGLVCNILQIIDVGRQTVDLIKNVYQNGSVDGALTHNAALLASISDTLPGPIKRPEKKHEQQLISTADICSKAARELQEEVHFLAGNVKKGSLARATLKVAIVTWRKPRLERLTNELVRAERLMQTGLLAAIW